MLKCATTTLLLITITFTANAGTPGNQKFQCNGQILNDNPPRTPQADFSFPEQLCYKEFAILHSDVARAPFWTSEYLTNTRVSEAIALKGRYQFYKDPYLKKGASPGDYTNSGYDRGHSAASNNMSTPESRLESFSMANIFPQDPKNNRALWFKIEYAVRSMALKYGDAYVVTGTYYGNNDVEIIGQKVMVPDHIYKAVYLPSKQTAGVYFAENKNTEDYVILSVDAFTTMTGIDPFPSLNEKIKLANPDITRPSAKRN